MYRSFNYDLYNGTCLNRKTLSNSMFVGRLFVKQNGQFIFTLNSNLHF